LKVIYIAGPYTGTTHDHNSFAEIHANIMHARANAIDVMRLGGCIALTPHLNAFHMELDFCGDQDFWYNADLELLRRCDAVFLVPGWEKSKGANLEKDFAEKNRIPVFTDLEHLRIWLEQLPFEHGA